MGKDFKDKYINSFDKIEIPESLEEKIAMIREDDRDEAVIRRKSWFKRPVAVIAFAAVIILAAGAVFAASAGLFSGSRSMRRILKIDVEMEQLLVNNGMVRIFGEPYAQTRGGVTIQPSMLVTDGYKVYITFTISGYDIRDRMEPDIKSQVDPAGLPGWTGSLGFYNDIVNLDDGRTAYSDGSKVELINDLYPVGRYLDEKGDLEYFLEIEGINNESMYGRKIHVELSNLCTYKENWHDIVNSWRDMPDDSPKEPVVMNIVEENWTFELEVPEQDSAADPERSVELSMPVEGLPEVTLDRVRITPLSVILDYTKSDGNGQSEDELPERRNYLDLAGIRMKSGEVIRGIVDSTLANPYYDEEGRNSGKCYSIVSLNQVIDPEEVEAVIVTEFNPKNRKGYSKTECEIDLDQDR